VFLERYVDRARHIEAQVIADGQGNVVFLGERDCSVQRRHQKLIEETPSPLVDETLRKRFAEAALSLTREAGYRNAGTIECILDEDGSFYFLEMNTRLQVEHTVTEMVTGLDIVALQIEVALGGSVAGLDVAPRGHAIQCRINAEDPGRNFLPGPGRITRYEEPGGPFVRVDSGVTQGREIPGDYDSMFAKLIVAGSDREQARHRMLRALDEYIVEGVPTTIPVHRWILGSEAFVDSTHTTTWLEKALADAHLPAQGDLSQGAGARAPRPRDILVEVDGRRVPVRIFDERREAAPRSPSSHGAAHGEHVHGEIHAPMQGTIVKVLVEKGQPIQAGDVVCILEAMKMENHIASTRDGEITDLPIRPGQVVETGQLLAVID
jgi:acetyl-CoA/propionyl-CoA/long-chain acyl-CoA carboxylase, biotin carboxylase, biotin carboxyl carrier protein